MENTFNQFFALIYFAPGIFYCSMTTKSNRRLQYDVQQKHKYLFLSFGFRTMLKDNPLDMVESVQNSKAWQMFLMKFKCVIAELSNTMIVVISLSY